MSTQSLSKGRLNHTQDAKSDEEQAKALQVHLSSCSNDIHHILPLYHQVPRGILFQ